MFDQMGLIDPNDWQSIVQIDRAKPFMCPGCHANIVFTLDEGECDSCGYDLVWEAKFARIAIKKQKEGSR